MFCSKCGSEINQGEKFCGKCGNAVAQEQVQYFAPQPTLVSPLPTVGKKPISKKSKIIIAGVAVVLVTIIVVAILLAQFLPPVIARNRIREALDSGNLNYLQSVYSEYFGIVEYYESDSNINMGGYVINSETDAISDELVEYFNEVAYDIGDYNLDGIYPYLCNKYGDIFLNDEGNSVKFWESEMCRYYVYPKVEEAYREMNTELRLALGG